MKTLCMCLMSGCMCLTMGCQQIAGTDFLFDPVILPEFEWVEPVEFQNKLRTCRSADYCSVDQLF